MKNLGNGRFLMTYAEVNTISLLIVFILITLVAGGFLYLVNLLK